MTVNVLDCWNSNYNRQDRLNVLRQLCLTQTEGKQHQAEYGDSGTPRGHQVQERVADAEVPEVDNINMIK